MGKYGLVLTGGGGKGAFQIGAWKALKEIGMDKDVAAISGASVGTLNAMLFCDGDIEKAQRIWKNIEPIMFLEPEIDKAVKFAGSVIIDSESLIKKISEKYENIRTMGTYEKFAQNKTGVFSRDGLLRLIQENINLEDVSKSDIEIYTDICRCTDEGLKPEYIKINGKSADEIRTITLAASALPYVYDAVMYDGAYYRDGGIIDNVPIRPLYDAGYRDIIVIGLKEDYGIDYSKYEGCNFIFIMPSHSLGDLMNGTLDFSNEGAKFRMALGYRNALRVLNAHKDGKASQPGYAEWLKQMSELDYEAAKQDVKQGDIFAKADAHMDKLKSIYGKYL